MEEDELESLYNAIILIVISIMVGASILMIKFGLMGV